MEDSFRILVCLTVVRYGSGMTVAASPRALPGREGILDAAAWLFLERGYTDTTLRDIASAAGVKAGSIYYHFASKDEMLTKILDEGIARITAAVEAALADHAGASHAERIEAAIRAHLVALFEHGPYTAAHVSVFPKTPVQVREAGLPARDAYERIWARLLASAQESGDLAADLDLPVARLSLLGSMNMTLDWFRPGGARTIGEVAGTMARLFMRGGA